jgi:hypothetical protein
MCAGLQRSLLAAGVAAVLAASGGEVRAVGLDALSEGAPISIDDAETVGIRTIQVNLPSSYSRQRSGDHQVRLGPELEYGLAQDVQISASVPLLFGSADRAQSGDLRMAAKWKFLDEYGWRPAVAAEVLVASPTGRESAGFDTALRMLATKNLPGRPTHRLHANLIVEHNAKATEIERANRRTAILGYDQRLTPQWLLVADVIYAQDRERGEADRLVELGARYRVASDVIGFGVGRGLSSSRTAWRLFASYQHSF